MSTQSSVSTAPKPAARVGRLRHWLVRHAGRVEKVYAAFEHLLFAAAPGMARIGFDRIERPVAALEGALKAALFDCKMCGQCVLASTGMSCPMNCPKTLRNGPCGGVRANGHCEVRPDMPCVWVKAYEGSLVMRKPAQIGVALPAINHALKGQSSWLLEARHHLKVQP